MNIVLALTKIAGHLYTLYFLANYTAPDDAELRFDASSLLAEARLHFEEITRYNPSDGEVITSREFHQKLNDFSDMLLTLDSSNRLACEMAIEKLLDLAIAADVELCGLGRDLTTADATP